MQKNKEMLLSKYLTALKGKWMLLLLFVLAVICLVYGSQKGKEEPKKEETQTVDFSEDYRQKIEDDIEALLCSVAGVGRVKVFVTIGACEEYVYAENQNASGSQYALFGGEGLLLSVKPPKVAGVAVLCDGADSVAVKAAITSLLTASLDIPSNHIAISRMKVE